jgi:uncharacterized protein YyaL (SSP411 family)
MARGGIHDVLGGGFSRYSVDGAWTVPHFEKMLYDNALLARAYLHGWQATADPELRAVCIDTLDWALREMWGPEGGFYSALDADSEGVEGRFYVWTLAQLQELLGDEAEEAVEWLSVSEQGNFEDPHHPEPGLNVLQDLGPRPEPDARERIRAKLLQAREQRTRPGLDDKRLTSWNALMISALADAGAVLEEPRYLDGAQACAEFLLSEMRDEQGRLLRTYNGGEAKIGAYLEDHAFLLEALILLFEVTCEERWYEAAITLADETIERFSDPERGGFFSTPADSPLPAGASSAALGLLRLAQLSGSEEYERQALSVMRLLYDIAPRHPGAFAHLLQAMHWYFTPARPIACAVPTGSRGSGRAPTG